jgi:hypothetical protein
MAYRALGVWCQENNLTLNVNKTKEMIMDLRKQQREQPPIHIDGTVVERVESFKFLCCKFLFLEAHAFRYTRINIC